MLSKTLGFFAGFIATFAAISLVQALGHAVIPPPADLDVKDQAAFAEWLATAPAGSFLFVLASYFAGAFLGPFVATWLGGVLRELGEISGRVYSEKLLGEIFGRFCVGK